jgi:hypothetical protein
MVVIPVRIIFGKGAGGLVETAGADGGRKAKAFLSGID